MAEKSPDGTILEQQSAVIGKILLNRSNVFDLSIPDEGRALYRLANKLQIVSKEKLIRK